MKYLIDYTREIFSLCQINKFKLWFIIFIGLISSALDYISLVIIGPIGNLLLNKNGNSFSVDNIYLQNIIDKMQIFYNGDIIITLSIIVLLIFLIKTYLVIFIYHLLVNIKLEISAILKVKLMKIYQNLDYKSFIKRDTSDYIQIMQQSVTRYSNALFSYLKMITEIIIIFAILLFLVLNKGAVTFLVFLFFAFFILIYQLIVGKKLINWGRLSNISFRKQIQSIQEGIEGLKELRINGKKKKFFDRLKINSYQLIKYSNFADTFSFAPRYLIEFLTLILLVGFYIFFLLFS
ncbi:MAG: ABC transporter ATP-binding protein [Pelagibacterales bacterium]|nr:ABC transporter ATP-binding protein [Pelagibacterales bacterium]